MSLYTTVSDVIGSYLLQIFVFCISFREGKQTMHEIISVDIRDVLSIIDQNFPKETNVTIARRINVEQSIIENWRKIGGAEPIHTFNLITSFYKANKKGIWYFIRNMQIKRFLQKYLINMKICNDKIGWNSFWSDIRSSIFTGVPFIDAAKKLSEVQKLGLSRTDASVLIGSRNGTFGEHGFIERSVNEKPFLSYQSTHDFQYFVKINKEKSGDSEINIVRPETISKIERESKRISKNIGSDITSKKESKPILIRQDANAPKFLELTIKDNNGKLWQTIIASAKTFSTGSVGYFVSDKITNIDSAERYQISGNFILIGSKPRK